MRKLLLLLPLIALLTACQSKEEKTVDSRRICALNDAGKLVSWEASAQLGLTEPMSLVEWQKLGWKGLGPLIKYCSWYKN